MATAKTATEPFEQFTSKTVDGLTLWADVNQKIARQFVDFSSAAAAESVRVYTDLQTSTVQAIKSAQAFAASQQGELQELTKDPVGAYQKGLQKSVDGAQQAFKAIEANVATVSKSAERIQKSAEKAGQDIQGTFTTLTTQLKTLYTPAAAK